VMLISTSYPNIISWKPRNAVAFIQRHDSTLGRMWSQLLTCVQHDVDPKHRYEAILYVNAPLELGFEPFYSSVTFNASVHTMDVNVYPESHYLALDRQFIPQLEYRSLLGIDN